jgi:hypothetical protein
VGGGKTVARVKLRADWQEYLDSLPDKARVGGKRKEWTAEEDAFLLAAHGRDYMRNICKRIGVSRNTALKRYRELTEEK